MRLTTLVFAVALALLLAAASESRAATTFGSDLEAPDVVDNGCDAGTCTRMLFTLGGQEVGSPVDGVVVRWRAVGKGNPRLRIVHREGDVWSAGAASEPATFPAGSELGEFATRLPIRAGDFLAVDGDRASQAFLAFTDAQAWFWFPVLQDGQVRAPRFLQESLEVLVNADVEPDADRDGYGDETQDCAPADPAVREGCGAGPGTPTDPVVPTDPGTGIPTGPGTGTPAPETSPDPVPVAPATAAGRCVVPRVQGLTLAKARAILRGRGCRRVSVRRVRVRAARRGRVLAQAPRAGGRAAAVRLRVAG